MSAVQDGATLLGRVGGTLVGRLRSAISPGARPSTDGSNPGWLVVTVSADPDDMAAAPLPAPLLDFGDRIEVDVRAAPGDKGTELAVRLRDPSPSGGTVSRLIGHDPQADLRSALRRAKQLIEVGEVLAVDPAPHGRRTATPTGVLLESWTKAAARAGVR